MKKTILLALAFLARMFATDNTARRNGNNQRNFNLLPALCVICLTAIITACGGGGGGDNTNRTPVLTPNATITVSVLLQAPAHPAEAVTSTVTTMITTTVHNTRNITTTTRIIETATTTITAMITTTVNNTVLNTVHNTVINTQTATATTTMTITTSVTTTRDIITTTTSTVTNTPPAVTTTMTITVAPIPPNLNSPDYGAYRIGDSRGASWIVVVSLTTDQPGQLYSIDILGENQQINKQAVFMRTTPFTDDLPELDRNRFYANGDIAARLDNNGTTVTLASGATEVAVFGAPSITMLYQLCAFTWMRTFLNSRINCIPTGSGLSFSPNMDRVIHAAMTDGFNGGLAIGESPLAFFGRYDDDERAAGFTYHLGNYALRTDYTRLPSKQDNNVWLDTYRLGLLHPINDEARFFAGIDNYKNAIFVLDTTGENLHRLGFAVGNGYAVKYELRIDL